MLGKKSFAVSAVIAVISAGSCATKPKWQNFDTINSLEIGMERNDAAFLLQVPNPPPGRRLTNTANDTYEHWTVCYDDFGGWHTRCEDVYTNSFKSGPIDLMFVNGKLAQISG